MSEKGRSLFANRWLGVGVGAAASVGFAYAAANSIAWGEVIDAFADFPIDAALLSIIPLVAAMLLRAYRWHVLLNGEKVRFRHVFVTQNAGIGLNNMLPVRVGSEALQLALITRRYRVPFASALATLVGGNVLDIFATALLMGLGVFLVPGLRDNAISIPLIGAVIMLVVSLLVLLGVSRGLGAIPLANRVSFFHRVIGALAQLKDRPGGLAASFTATLVHWFLMGVSGWILASGLGIDVDPVTMATVIVAATFFTSAIPSLPGGAGTYHAAVITMLVALGADRAIALTFAIVIHALVFIPPMAVAGLVISRAGSAVLLRKHQGDQGGVPQGAVHEEPEE